MEKPINYLITYQCAECKMESAFAERDQPSCRYCDHETTLTQIKKQEITPQLLEERIKALSDNMLTNLQKAYEQLEGNEEIKFSDGEDPEKEMLELLAKVKSFKDQIDGLELRKNEDDN